MKRLIHIIIVWLFPLASSAQLKQLEIGDTIPAQLLSSLSVNRQPITINHKLQTTNPSHTPLGDGGNTPLEPVPGLIREDSLLPPLGGKGVILDFFATWCASCIRELPRLDSLQKQFGEKFQVILIAYEPDEKLKAFRKRNKLFAACSLPVVSGDSIWQGLFPHTLLPHEVWISREGTVAAITSNRYITAENIQTFLAGKPLRLPVKKDILSFDPSLPLLQNDNGASQDALLFSSRFMPHLPGIFSGAGRSYSADSSSCRSYHLNKHILSLYAAALNRPVTNRVVLQVKDTSRFIHTTQPEEQWLIANTYCYELTLPAYAKDNSNTLMQQDLDRYLGIKSSIEQKLMPCYVLVAASSKNKVAPPAGQIAIPIDKWIKRINYQYAGKPFRPVVIDESGYTGTIDIEPPLGAYNISDLNKQLELYGLLLLPAQRQIEVLVLKDATGSEK